MKKQLFNPVAPGFLTFLNIMSYPARISALPLNNEQKLRAGAQLSARINQKLLR